MTFTASVTSAGGTPTGTVTFTVDNVNRGTVTLVGGTASITFSNLALGSRLVQAIYSGSSLDQASAGYVFESIVAPGSNPGAQPTSTFLSASSSTVSPGTPVIVTAQVTAATGTPTGYVIFYVNNVQQSPTVALTASGAASIALLISGDSTIQAFYLGDLNFFSAVVNTSSFRRRRGSDVRL